jgi:NADH dehydrogenase (ubiquinone) Fe-S protein 6
MLPVSSIRRAPARLFPVLRQYSSAAKDVILPTATELAPTKASPEEAVSTEEMREFQAPNRAGIWSRSQKPREQAMVGPRFEQMIIKDQVCDLEFVESKLTEQPRPYAAIDLIHKQPVRWSHERTVSCDGGGGPLGHPRIFINLDKPQVNWCTYCGLPFVSITNFYTHLTR